MNKNLWKKIIIVILCVTAIVLILLKVFNNNKKTSNIQIVTSTSKFYTVSNCADRFLKYLSSENIDNLLILLDDSYKKDNNISKDNIFNIINRLDGEYSFNAKKMYQQKINDNIMKYYVKGYILKEDIDNNGEKIDYYIIVLLDENNSTYSIIPYDEELFNKEVSNE